MGDVLNFFLDPIESGLVFWLLGAAVFAVLIPFAIVADRRSQKQYKQDRANGRYDSWG